MSRISSGLRSRNAAITPSLVTVTAVGQHSHTRASTTDSSTCFQSLSKRPKCTVMTPPPPCSS